LIVELERHGAAVLTEEETARFPRAAVEKQTGWFQLDIIGQSAVTLAELATIQRRYPIQLLVIPTDLVDGESCLAAEKLALVLSLFTSPTRTQGSACATRCSRRGAPTSSSASRRRCGPAASW
jgi:hypothetical protein